MALNWNISHCANVDDLKADTPNGWPVTDCTIWHTLIIGMHEITEKNAEQFWTRVHSWELIAGPINTSGRLMEPRDIVARIGLYTNASTLNNVQWRRKLADKLAEKADAVWRKTAGGAETLAMQNAQARA